MSSHQPAHLSGHVALVTGANHGIGAATARRLASDGAAVLITHLRIDEAADPGIPEAYRVNRAGEADTLVDASQRRAEERTAASPQTSSIPRSRTRLGH